VIERRYRRVGRDLILRFAFRRASSQRSHLVDGLRPPLGPLDAQAFAALDDGGSAEARGGGHGLFADLYELTMLSAYGTCGVREAATFSLFVRELPERRNFLLACGVDDLLDELASFRFRADDIAYRRSLNIFPESLFADLPDFRFAGDVFAVAERTPIFANEPILEVTAPIGQAQVVETLIVNQISLQTGARLQSRPGRRCCGRASLRRFRRAAGASARGGAERARAFAIAGVA